MAEQETIETVIYFINIYIFLWNYVIIEKHMCHFV